LCQESFTLLYPALSPKKKLKTRRQAWGLLYAAGDCWFYFIILIEFHQRLAGEKDFAVIFFHIQGKRKFFGQKNIENWFL